MYSSVSVLRVFSFSIRFDLQPSVSFGAMTENMPSSLNLFQSFISGSVHKVLKYNRKYKIMFNKRKKKKNNSMFMYNFYKQ